MRPKLSEFASIAEIVASIGVIISLVFVGFQLSEANRETRATNTQLALGAEMGFTRAFVDNAATWHKLVTGAALAPGEEMRRGIVLFNMLMLESANRFRQFNSGYLDPELWEARLRILPILVKYPIYEIWRKAPGAQGQPSDFLDFLDALSEGE